MSYCCGSCHDYESKKTSSIFPSSYKSLTHAFTSWQRNCKNFCRTEISAIDPPIFLRWEQLQLEEVRQIRHDTCSFLFNGHSEKLRSEYRIYRKIDDQITLSDLQTTLLHFFNCEILQIKLQIDSKIKITLKSEKQKEKRWNPDNTINDSIQLHVVILQRPNHFQCRISN